MIKLRLIREIKVGSHCPNSKMAGARRERSVRRHRQGCRPAVLKFEETTVQHVRGRLSRVVPYSTGEADMLDCAALSMGVRGRRFHGCFQSDSMSTFIWTMVEVAKAAVWKLALI